MQISKKYLVIGTSGLLALVLSISFFPSTYNCPLWQPSVCGLTTNATLLVGASVVLVTMIKDKMSAGLNVQVRLDNGELRNGVLTSKAVGNRRVDAKDLVLLNCTKATESPEKDGSNICELEFTGFDPHSACVKGTPCYGKIPSWSIRVGADGLPDPELLRFR